MKTDPAKSSARAARRAEKRGRENTHSLRRDLAWLKATGFDNIQGIADERYKKLRCKTRENVGSSL